MQLILSLNPIDQWGILIAVLFISLMATYIAFEELPNEDDMRKMLGASNPKD